MNHLTRLLLPSLAGLAFAVTASAQGSRTMRPALLESAAAIFSFSSKEEIDDGRFQGGEVGVNRLDLSFAGSFAWQAAGGQGLYGLAFSRTEIDADAGMTLPDTLQEVSLSLGFRRELSANWGLAAYLRPGFYGDFEDLDGDSFNAPLLLLTSYRESAERMWFFGLNANAFSDNPVLPALGVRWRFAPSWTFDLGYPRTTVMWDGGAGLKAGLLVAAQGGNYRITDSLGVPAPGVARLANTYVDYNEFRAGLRLEKAWSQGLALEVEVGALLEREFDFHDRDYELDGGGGFFGTVALRGRF
jgi:hypothetical protein